MLLVAWQAEQEKALLQQRDRRASAADMKAQNTAALAVELEEEVKEEQQQLQPQQLTPQQLQQQQTVRRSLQRHF